MCVGVLEPEVVFSPAVLSRAIDQSILVEPHVCGAVVIFGVCTCWLLVCMVCLHLFILYESILVGELNSLRCTACAMYIHVYVRY